MVRRFCTRKKAGTEGGTLAARLALRIFASSFSRRPRGIAPVVKACRLAGLG